MNKFAKALAKNITLIAGNVAHTALWDAGVISDNTHRPMRSEAVENVAKAERAIAELFNQPGLFAAIRKTPSTRGKISTPTTNAHRAIRAERALEAWRGNEIEDEADFADLLSDLMHLARTNSIDFENELNRAVRNFDAER